MMLSEAHRVVQVLGSQLSAARLAKMKRVLACRLASLHIVLENMSNPANAAACLRTADAMGVHTVHVVSPHATFLPLPRDVEGHSLVATAQRGSMKWLHVVHHPHIMACYEALRQARATILASALDPGSTPLHSALEGVLPVPADEAPPLPLAPLALVFGNEHRGTTKYARREADALWHLPQCGMVQSLNVGVALGMGVYQARQLLQERGLAPPAAVMEGSAEEVHAAGPWQACMSQDEQTLTLAGWMLQSVPAADLHLQRAGVSLDTW